ncbi:transmembrane protein 218, partial [Chelydra serpentina]
FELEQAEDRARSGRRMAGTVLGVGPGVFILALLCVLMLLLCML